MIYLAAPMFLYTSDLYATAVADLEGQGLEVCDVRHMYSDNADWRERWPDEKHRYSSCWIVTDPRGWIGRATDIERADLAKLGRPVWWWNRRTTEFDLSLPTRDWARWRRLLPVRG